MPSFYVLKLASKALSSGTGPEFFTREFAISRVKKVAIQRPSSIWVTTLKDHHVPNPARGCLAEDSRQVSEDCSCSLLSNNITIISLFFYVIDDSCFTRTAHIWSDGFHTWLMECLAWCNIAHKILVQQLSLKASTLCWITYVSSGVITVKILP
jgi:hypothetical protein